MRQFNVQFHNVIRLLAVTACFALLCLASVSCVSHDQLDTTSGFTQQVPELLSGMPQLSRLASASSDFLPFQNGADYAADLPNNLCAASNTDVVFTPNYAAPNRSLLDAAYCLYRLELDPAATTATLTLVWNGNAPESALFWVGLANWQTGIWDWQPLTSNELAIGNPSAYGDTAKHCYVAVVALGTASSELVSISFGPLPPPPPTNGYTLFAPMSHQTTYLIDDDGVVVHSWTGEYVPGASVFLDEQGYLWRQVRIDNSAFPSGGQAGMIEKVDWDGNVVWFYGAQSTTMDSHHDFVLLPNGNVMFLVWNLLTTDQAIAAGRNPSTINPRGFFIDSILEVDSTQAEPTIVWQWYAGDHLIQDFDRRQANYGDPAAHPELLDLNYYAIKFDDWLHLNTVKYNAELDQIAISSYCMCEIWIIDHSTTTEEAAGHTGGRCGRGGDLLYRWGNPQAYRAGTEEDQLLYMQHDVHWIDDGLQGAGDLLIFNNLAGSAEGQQYSQIVEITPPLNPDGTYYMTGSVYGPSTLTWQYEADPPGKFFGLNMSSSQRLPDDSTLICVGPTGNFFRVTPEGETIWEYQNPYPIKGSAVFRATRYRADYPGLANLAK